MFNFFKKKKTKETIVMSGVGGKVGGSFDGVVTKADGSIKKVIPKQTNLITDLGWQSITGELQEKFEPDVFPDWGTNSRRYLIRGDNDHCGCVLGDGVGEPTVADIKLGHAVLADHTNYNLANSNKDKSWEWVGTEMPNETHPNHIKCTLRMTFKYTPDVQAYNLTELGLCIFPISAGTPYYNYEKYWAEQLTVSDSDKYKYSYILMTHALFKDSSGNAEVISLDVGDILTLNYYLDYYLDIRTHKGEITLKRINKDKTESLETYEYTCSLMGNLAMNVGNYDCFLPRPPSVCSSINSSGTAGKLATDVAIPLKYALTEEERPTSDFANFDIDSYTSGILAYRDHVMYSGLSTNNAIDYGVADTTWENIGAYYSNNLAYKRVLKGLLKVNPYLDTLAQSDVKWYYYSYNDITNGSNYNATDYLFADVNTSSYYSYDTGVYYPYSKPSQFLTDHVKRSYCNFTEEKDPELYSLYLPFAGSTHRVLMRFTYPTFDQGSHYTTLEDGSKDRYFRAIVFASAYMTGNSTHFCKDIFSSRYLLVFSNKETKRGIKINSNEFFQIGLESTIERWTGE